LPSVTINLYMFAATTSLSITPLISHSVTFQALREPKEFLVSNSVLVSVTSLSAK